MAPAEVQQSTDTFSREDWMQFNNARGSLKLKTHYNDVVFRWPSGVRPVDWAREIARRESSEFSRLRLSCSGELRVLFDSALSGSLHEPTVEQWLESCRKKVRERERTRRRDMALTLRRGNEFGSAVAFDPLAIAGAYASAPPNLARGIPLDGLTAFFGRAESGKSTLAGMLAVSVALGRPFLGQPTNGGEHAGILYCALEDPVGVSQRMMAFAGDRAGELPKRIAITSRVPDLLQTDPGWAARAAGSAGLRQLDLIVVDTFSKLLGRHGADEVSGAPRIIDALTNAAAETGASVLVIAHTRKGADDERGSALREGADVMIPVVRESVDADSLSIRVAWADRKLAKWRHGGWPSTDLQLEFGFSELGKPHIDSIEEVPHRPTSKKPGGRGSSSTRQPTGSDRIMDEMRGSNGAWLSVADLVSKTGLAKSTVSGALAKFGDAVETDGVGKGKRFRLK